MLKDNAIEVFETPTFKKSFKKLTTQEKDFVEEEIDKIIKDPDIGVQKKGDLSHLWVHKFIIFNQQILLGYSWKKAVLELYLLNMGVHENFYRDAKSRHKQDIKILR